MFQLVFKGECTAGTDLATARANAGALFKANLEQIDRMFSGQPVVIRNKLDEGQAEKYRLVLQKHGMVAYVEAMAGTRPPEQKPAARPKPAPAAATPTPTAPAAPSASPPAAAPERASAKGGGPAVEPGDRPRLAGEKVDDILAGSGLSLDPPGVTLVKHQETAPPLFQHLDSWTLAPAGSELGEKRETPPPVNPDISHLSLADEDQ